MKSALLKGILVCLSVTIVCCKQQAEKEPAYPLETARLVSMVTSGTISAEDEIIVVFVTDIVDTAQTGQSLRKAVFEFEPPIEGTALWADRRKLVFKPGQKLPFRTTFQGRLDLQNLLPRYRSGGLSDLRFSFTVAGREIAAFNAELKPYRDEDPSMAVLSGTISFTEETDMEIVKRSCLLKGGGKSIELDWRSGTEPDQFKFSSRPVGRSKDDGKILFSVAARPLDLSRDFQREFTVPALRELKIVDVFSQAEGRQPRLKLVFSEALKHHQQLEGFVEAEPPLELKLRQSEQNIYVSGNFEHGRSYRLIVHPGLRSMWGSRMAAEHRETVQFEDMKPEIRFSGNGVFLTSGNQHKILFQTVNVKRVDLKIDRVFESNIGQFLQMQNLDGSRERRQRFPYNVDHVGVPVARRELIIGQRRNRWLQHELDLAELISDQDRGLFLIGLSFTRDDMLYDVSMDNLNYQQSYDYYNDPASYGYIYNHGQIYKPLIVSDIGLTTKQAGPDYFVFATNLSDGRPMAGVRVRLRSLQNQLLAEGFTDDQGLIHFSDITEKVFFIEGEKYGQRSVVKPSGMGWNLSTFDTDGVNRTRKGVRAFIFTERGVYRPGDDIHIGVLLRNDQNTWPDGHPVSIAIRNPKNRLIFERVNRSGHDGFYLFPFRTEAGDVTGAYKVDVKAGSQVFYHVLKIETVVAERLKVDLITDKTKFAPQDDKLGLTLAANYLFGNPAAGLQAEVDIRLTPRAKTFDRYSDYSFINEATRYQPVTHRLFEGRLDAEGRAAISWPFPSFAGVPSMLAGRISAKVYEKGGRFSRRTLAVQFEPYDHYTGIKKPQTRWGYARTGQELELPVILLDASGNELAGQTLNYRIYKNERRWWWEYDSQDQFRLRFKQDQSTELVTSGQLISASGPVTLSFTPEARGQYLVEVQDTGRKGHMAAVFINAYPWGEAPLSGKDAGILAMRTDRKRYSPGEEALITFPVPDQATVLFTLEKADRLLESRWLRPPAGKNEMSVRVAVTEQMLPNVYASVSVIQPQKQITNDRPGRMYGIVPLFVEDNKTHQRIELGLPGELQSGQDFSVEVQTADRRPSQFTIAVVDEGLLSLTGFRTPDPWQAFFSKERLAVFTADLFNQVIGLNRGDIYQTFAIGGGMAADEVYRAGQLEEQGGKRFEPVSLFKGPLQTDSDGHASVNFSLPDYAGAVRVMVVSAKGNRYGHAQKTVPVKSDLMLGPTLPRVVGPQDRFTIPVTVFAMTGQAGTVTVDLKLSGPLRAVKGVQRRVAFSGSGQQEVFFEVEAEAAAGTAKILIEAGSESGARARWARELSVRASSPVISESVRKSLVPGQKAGFVIPDKGISGTNHARIIVQRRPGLRLTRRILWLIRYPYGCIEQNVSSVFPQLYLQEFIPKSRAAKRDIDKNINRAIERLRTFQLSSGAFSYWPGSSEESDWGSCYAGHFLIEARKLGYSVPDALYGKWLNWMKRKARLGSRDKLTRLYRVYVLALAGQAQLGAMNLLKENHLDKMTDTEKWLLAGAYRMAGAEQTANRIVRSAGRHVEAYQEFGGTYGSTLRDKAMILEQLTLSGRWEEAQPLAEELSTALSADTWYSTQTTGYVLLALGKFFKATEGQQERKILAGSIHLPDGRKQEFKTEDINYSLEIDSGFGKQVQVELNDQTTLERAFVTLDWSGKPAQYTGQDEQKNLRLQVDWLDEDGMSIDPSERMQGDTFWGHFRISRPRDDRSKIEELALVQLLPAGWEIDNLRLTGEVTPRWMRGWRLGRQEYQDIRDDRILWFFDLNPGDSFLDFVVKLNAVTVGKFNLPPIQVEAMYNHDYRAVKKGGQVRVQARGAN